MIFTLHVTNQRVWLLIKAWYRFQSLSGKSTGQVEISIIANYDKNISMSLNFLRLDEQLDLSSRKTMLYFRSHPSRRNASSCKMFLHTRLCWRSKYVFKQPALGWSARSLYAWKFKLHIVICSDNEHNQNQWCQIEWDPRIMSEKLPEKSQRKASYLFAQNMSTSRDIVCPNDPDSWWRP